MPASFATRAYAENRRVWAVIDGRHPKPVETGLFADAERAFERSADRLQERFLVEQRNRIVAAIRNCAAHPELFWRHRYFDHARGGVRFVLSTDEGVALVARALADAREKRGSRDYDRHEVMALQEALIFARFMRRNAKRLWLGRVA